MAKAAAKKRNTQTTAKTVKTVKKTEKDVKEKKQKRTFKEKRSKLEEAFNAGYNAGWNARETFSGVTGESAAVQLGVSRGLRDHKKSDKFQSRLKKAK